MDPDRTDFHETFTGGVSRAQDQFINFGDDPDHDADPDYDN